MNNKRDDALYYTCSLIEYIGRKTKNKRVDVVNALDDVLLHKIYELADVYHSDNIDRVSDDFIAAAALQCGDFDNVGDCLYALPSFWAIGKVYANLVSLIVEREGVAVAHAIVLAYSSPVSDLVSNFNSVFYCENPENIYIAYSEGVIE